MNEAEFRDGRTPWLENLALRAAIVIASAVGAMALLGCSLLPATITVQNDTPVPMIVRIFSPSRTTSWLVPPEQESTIFHGVIDSASSVQVIDLEGCEILDTQPVLAQSFSIAVLPTFSGTFMVLHADEPPLKQHFVDPSATGC